MSGVVLLDSGPLGLATSPGGSSTTAACIDWLRNLLRSGSTVIVPEIADYEVRRELIRARKYPGIARLDALIERVAYLAITTAAMRLAAEFWAEARQLGRPAAADAALDRDVIIAAQAATADFRGVVVATTNPRHLSPFVEADLWFNIGR